MDISNLSVSNSDNGKKELEERRFEKVIEGTATVVKKTGKRFLSDDASNVGSYVFEDVVLPTVKKFLYDIMVKAAKILWYGRNGPADSYNKNVVPASRVSYSDPSINPIRNKQESVEKLSGYFFQNLLFSERTQAENVLFAMDEALAMYGKVSVRDFYDFAGKTGSYTDMNYGWKSLDTAKIVEVTEGFMIQLPKVKPLT